MIDDLGLAEARQLDQAFEGDPYDVLGALEAEIPLSEAMPQGGKSYGPRDPTAAMKPKAGGKRIKLPDLSPAIQKMLARNKNRSQMGPNFRNDEADKAQRFYYADYGDDI